MNYFQYKNNQLHVEDVSVADIVKQFGTPCFIYSSKTLEKNWDEFEKHLSGISHRICYAVKANSNLSILKLFAERNAGFDIVSIGEMERVLKAGGDPQRIIFSGVGKSTDEISRAIDANIFCFNVESDAELERLQHVAKSKNKKINFALRINPDINAKTHPYIATGLHENKFGIDLEKTKNILKNISSMPNLQLIGLACHIGSQLTHLEPFIQALDCLLHLIEEFPQLKIQHVDIGGGFAVIYRDEQPPTIAEYLSSIRQKISSHQLELIIEPGRSLVAHAGILVTKVEYIKNNSHKNFAIVDAGMNDYIRPALYDAWQTILPVEIKNNIPDTTYDIVGPVCESGDFFGKDRKLAIQQNDLLVILTVGAYGSSMSSNYNSRPRAAEVLVDGKNVKLIRKRETTQDLFLHEI